MQAMFAIHPTDMTEAWFPTVFLQDFTIYTFVRAKLFALANAISDGFSFAILSSPSHMRGLKSLYKIALPHPVAVKRFLQINTDTVAERGLTDFLHKQRHCFLLTIKSSATT